MAIIIWNTSRQQSALVEAQALQSAERMTNALTEFRTIYTSEVVERVRKQGIPVTHDYKQREGAIPLPATLSMMLGNQIGARESKTRTRLYSAFPFPWRRADGGLIDDFAEDAWESLINTPDTPFYRFEELGGTPVLRYATADLMRSGCVGCHNSNPDSPKTDWKVGDVRGVLEVTTPLTGPLDEARSGLVETVALMVLFTVGGLLVISAVLSRLRQVATEAQELTKQTQEANRGLESEVKERMRAEEALLASGCALKDRVADLEKAQRMLVTQGESLTRLADDLLIARDEACAADRAKSEFLAAMSHELRTPLNTVIGFAEVMEDEIFGPIGNSKYRDYSVDIRESGQHLLGLINDILDLTKIESGKDTLHEEEIEISQIIRSSLSLVGQRAEQGKIKLELQIPDHLPALRADVRKLKQILVNLLSNAIKFTESGGQVTLSTWCQRDSGHVFEVVDTGIGIEAKDIPKALSRFGQVDGDLNRQYQGTGLGLPLSKALVELHGGTFELQSENGVGTTATVRFPVTRIVAPPDTSDVLKVADRAVS
jgi:signal transduction histidine kinase